MKHFKTYQFSSLPDFIGQKRNESKILNSQVFPDYFNSIEDVWVELNDWLSYGEEDGFNKGLAFAKAGPLYAMYAKKQK